MLRYFLGMEAGGHIFLLSLCLVEPTGLFPFQQAPLPCSHPLPCETHWAPPFLPCSLFFLHRVPSVYSLSHSLGGPISALYCVPEHVSQRGASAHVWCPNLPLRRHPLIALRSWVPQDCSDRRGSSWQVTTPRAPH